MAPDDLPGLDDDFPPEEGTPEVSEPSTSEPAPSETPAAPDAPEWTSEELDEWFENEVGGESGVPEDIEVDPHDPEFAEAVAAYKRLEPNDYAPIAPWVLSQAHTAWEQLSDEMKEQFRRGWARRQAAASKPDIDEETDSVMDDMEVLPPIGSLPHDGPFDDPPEESVIDELAPYPPAGGVPHDEEEDTSPAPGSFRWLMLGIAAVVIAILLSITAVAAGWTGFGGGTTTTVAALAVPVTTTTLGVAVTTSSSSTTTTTAPVVTTTTLGVAVTTSTSSTTTTTAPVVTTTTLGVAVTTSTSSTTTTTAPVVTTTTTAPSTGAKSYSVNMPCPNSSSSTTIWLDVYITAGATNVSYSLPDPNDCADTTVSHSGELIPGSPEAGKDTFRITFSLVGGAGATGGTDPVTARVTWTNP